MTTTSITRLDPPRYGWLVSTTEPELIRNLRAIYGDPLQITEHRHEWELPEGTITIHEPKPLGLIF